MNQKRGKSNQSILIVAGVAVVAVGVLIAMSLLSSKKEVPPPVVQTGENSDQAHNIVRGVWGSKDAKVVLEEYLDYG